MLLHKKQKLYLLCYKRSIEKHKWTNFLSYSWQKFEFPVKCPGKRKKQNAFFSRICYCDLSMNGCCSQVGCMMTLQELVFFLLTCNESPDKLRLELNCMQLGVK